MTIDDFKVGDIFGYIENIKFKARMVNKIMLGKITRIESKSAGEFEYSGASIYYFPDEYTKLIIGMMADRTGNRDKFRKETKAAKCKMIELLFIPNKKFQYREY